jgi:hypothetical protein
MSAYKRKTRMLSIRLSDEEYRMLLNASLGKGSRSVSEYARNSIFRAVQSSPANAESLKARMEEFESDLHSISRSLQRLQQITAHLPGAAE